MLVFRHGVRLARKPRGCLGGRRRRRRTALCVEGARSVRGEEEGEDEGQGEGEARVRCVRDEDAAADGKGGGS